MSYCVVRCWCCTTPCTTLYDASYAPDASGPDALYDAPTRRTMHFRQHSPTHPQGVCGCVRVCVCGGVQWSVSND